jgi:hypothetical protein
MISLFCDFIVTLNHGKKKRKKKSIVNWRKIREFRVDNGILFCYFFKKKNIYFGEKLFII